MTCTTCGSVALHLTETALCPFCQLRAHRDPNKTVMWSPSPSAGAAVPPAARARRRPVIAVASGGLFLAASLVTHLLAPSWFKPLLFVGGLVGLIAVLVQFHRNKNRA